LGQKGSSVTSERAISFAERKTFRAFVLLYSAMALAILTLAALLYFSAAKTRMLSEHRLAMQLEGERYLPELLAWMQGDLKHFPKDPAYETAFYLGGKQVEGAFFEPPARLTPGIQMQGERIYLVIPMAGHGLEVGALVMMTRDDGLWLYRYRQNVVLYGLLLFILQGAVGFWLSKLFLRPMRYAVKLLDDFIKDTTHELNTPVTAILTNIERLDLDGMDEKQQRKIMRIETAARTIGTIYEDLTYLLLRKASPDTAETIDMGTFVRERLEYFRTRFDAKHLTAVMTAAKTFEVRMERHAAARLLDNLLSNAVKYSDIGGKVEVGFAEGQVRIVNTGSPIPEEKRDAIFERYVRADEGQGGFGIGLHLVARIAEAYGIRVEVDVSGRRSAFTLLWPRYKTRSI